MGFYIKKSVNLGPLRLNLSKSGIGVSTGVKGLRVGVDGKGRTYVGGGKGILRYRKQISPKKHETQGDSGFWKAMALILLALFALGVLYFINPELLKSLL